MYFVYYSEMRLQCNHIINVKQKPALLGLHLTLKLDLNIN